MPISCHSSLAAPGRDLADADDYQQFDQELALRPNSVLGAAELSTL